MYKIESKRVQETKSKLVLSLDGVIEIAFLMSKGAESVFHKPTGGDEVEIELPSTKF